MGIVKRIGNLESSFTKSCFYRQCEYLLSQRLDFIEIAKGACYNSFCKFVSNNFEEMRKL